MKQMDLSGSCLCGAVQYKVQGDYKGFYLCHCKRCRKVSGSAHASNLMLENASLVWISGEDNLERYKVPEAERYYTQNCRSCHSPLPRPVPQLKAIIIPAGSLDVDPGVVPSMNIFWASRSEWTCQNNLECHAEYPEK